MKSFIMILLCSSLFLEGCSSSSAITEKERAHLRLDPDRTIFVKLNDGSGYILEPYHYIEVTEPANFVFGVGEKLDKATGKYEPFKGKLHPISTDSSDVDTVITTGWSGRKKMRFQYIIFGLSDSTNVRFKQDDYVVAHGNQGSGFWCAGAWRSNGPYTHFTGRIPPENIESISVWKEGFHWWDFIPTGVSTVHW